MNKKIKIGEHLLPMINDVVEHTLKNYNGRKIVLWGKYVVSENISYVLEKEHNIPTEFYVDSDESKHNYWDTFSPEKIKGLSNEYYVIIPLAFYQSLKNQLIDYGYTAEKDYYYFCDCIIKHDDLYYEDAHGNKIIGRHKGLHFCFSGFNNTINIGEKVRAYIYIYIYAQ